MISSCFTYGFILAVFFSFTGADVTVIQGQFLIEIFWNIFRIVKQYTNDFT